MSRDLFINGPSLVLVKSRVDSAIGNLAQLGLSEAIIQVSPNFYHDDVHADAWGDSVPFEQQFFLSDATISMTLVHFDRTILDECIRLSMAGAPAIGQLPVAGARMGNNVARFAAGNNYVGLNITSPIGNKPWRFFYTHLASNFTFPLGTKRSVAQLTFRAIPYSTDPYGVAGAGSAGTALWDYSNDV